jgi:hypothetical protein
LPPQSGRAWASIIPVAEARASYNGLLLLLFVAGSAALAAAAIHRFAARGVRRAPAWDCGFPDPDPATQYTALSLAQPVRRIFGTLLFRARERVAMPAPGSTAPAHHAVTWDDLAWPWLFGPAGRLALRAGAMLNRLQRLSIRAWLGLVFATLVLMLAGFATWV